MEAGAARSAEGRAGEAVAWATVLGFAGASASLLVASLVGGWLSSAHVASVSACAGLPGAACGASFGLLRTPRSRLVALWATPPLVVGAGALFVAIVLWPQPEHGGLATAGVAFLALQGALATAAVALLLTLARRAPPRRQRRVLALAGAAMLAFAAVRVATTGAPHPQGSRPAERGSTARA